MRHFGALLAQICFIYFLTLSKLVVKLSSNFKLLLLFIKENVFFYPHYLGPIGPGVWVGNSGVFGDLGWGSLAAPVDAGGLATGTSIRAIAHNFSSGASLGES